MVVKRVPLQASTSNLLALKLFADSIGDVIAHSGVKVGSFTRDMTAASGNQAVPGVGFPPVAVIFIWNIDTTTAFGIGLDDGTNRFVVVDYSYTSTGTYVNNTGVSISIINTAGAYQNGNITSPDADGFTIAWTKGGFPTGMATIGYIAFR